MATTAELTKALGVRSGVVKPEYVDTSPLFATSCAEDPLVHVHRHTDVQRVHW